MFVIGQSGMDRIPLDPRFEIIGIGDIGNAGENLRTIVESRKVRKMALLHPSLEERRANLVKFQQKNFRHRRSQARSERSEFAQVLQSALARARKNCTDHTSQVKKKARGRVRVSPPLCDVAEMICAGVREKGGADCATPHCRGEDALPPELSS